MADTSVPPPKTESKKKTSKGTWLSMITDGLLNINLFSTGVSRPGLYKYIQEKYGIPIARVYFNRALKAGLASGLFVAVGKQRFKLNPAERKAIKSKAKAKAKAKAKPKKAKKSSKKAKKGTKKGTKKGAKKGTKKGAKAAAGPSDGTDAPATTSAGTEEEAKTTATTKKSTKKGTKKGAKKAANKKGTAKKGTAKKAKKATGKKATGKKATGKKATGKKATGKKATGKKATGKKAAKGRGSAAEAETKTAPKAKGGRKKAAPAEDAAPALKKAKSAGKPPTLQRSGSLCVIPQSGLEGAVYTAGGVVYEANLAIVNIATDTDQFHKIQVVESPDKTQYHVVQHWGRTGTRGEVSTVEFKTLDTALAEFEKVFTEKTGATWAERDTYEPAEGKYSLKKKDHARVQKGTVMWKYYMDDGVDGKATGWYDYAKEASDHVEGTYQEFKMNKAWLTVRSIKSGYFSYHVNFSTMSQTNNKTKKVRKIQRFVDGQMSDE